MSDPITGGSAASQEPCPSWAAWLFERPDAEPFERTEHDAEAERMEAVWWEGAYPLEAEL